MKGEDFDQVEQSDLQPLKPEFRIARSGAKKRSKNRASGEVLSFGAFQAKRKPPPEEQLAPVNLDTFFAVHQPDLYQREQAVKEAHAELLQRAKQKYIRNTIVGLSNQENIPSVSSVSLTEAEQKALNELSSEEKFALQSEAYQAYHQQKDQADAQLLERYMTMYLRRFRPPVLPVEDGQAREDEINKHKYIRESFTESEIKRIDDMEAAALWRSIATKPEMLKLIGNESSLLVDYQELSEAELIREAELAARRIYDAAKDSAIAITAPSGGGKSRLLGRKICYTNALQKIGSVTIDCVGGSIDNALQKITEIEDAELRKEVISRIRYINTAGVQVGDEVYVTGWPMLAQRYPNESLATRTQRIVQLIATTDAALAEASIQGMNRLTPLLTSVATILAALDLPLAFAFSLLKEPDVWRQHLTELGEQVPETSEAVAELLAFYELEPRQQEERSEVLRNKLAYLRHNEVKRAMFSAPKE